MGATPNRTLFPLIYPRGIRPFLEFWQFFVRFLKDFWETHKINVICSFGVFLLKNACFGPEDHESRCFSTDLAVSRATWPNCCFCPRRRSRHSYESRLSRGLGRFTDHVGEDPCDMQFWRVFAQKRVFRHRRPRDSLFFHGLGSFTDHMAELLFLPQAPHSSPERKPAILRGIPRLRSILPTCLSVPRALPPP